MDSHNTTLQAATPRPQMMFADPPAMAETLENYVYTTLNVFFEINALRWGSGAQPGAIWEIH